MNIYRWTPNAGDYRAIGIAIGGGWWPKGMDLGSVAEAHVDRGKGFLGETEYHTIDNWATTHRPHSDFPASIGNLCTMSPRAYEALRHLRGMERAIRVTVDRELPYLMIQPPQLEGTLDLRHTNFVRYPPLKSRFPESIDEENVIHRFYLTDEKPGDYIVERNERALRNAGMLEGLNDHMDRLYPGIVLRRESEPMWYLTRHFIERAVTSDIFWMKEQMPYADVYVTENVRQAALASGLTGLDCLEPVFITGKACLPRYTKFDREIRHISNYGTFQREFELIRMRGNLSFMLEHKDLEPVIAGLSQQGIVPWRTEEPTPEFCQCDACNAVSQKP
jgi:hypothetical protein